MVERTLAIIKPDAVRKQATGKIIDMIISNGFRVLGMKMVRISKEQAQAFYAVHRERPFYNDLVDYMISGPIVVMALEKDNAVEDYRKLIGDTDPMKAEAGTVRKLFGESKAFNAVHGSDSPQNGIVEVSFFFSENEIIALQ